jgi:hypothetical protein
MGIDEHGFSTAEKENHESTPRTRIAAGSLTADKPAFAMRLPPSLGAMTDKSARQAPMHADGSHIGRGFLTAK